MVSSFEIETGEDTAPHLSLWPFVASSAFRRHESTAVIGHGDEVWERATRDVLRWEVKTRSGFAVADARRVVPGAETTITARVAGITVREPVRVHAVVEEATRVGFSYRTLPGHPVSGEEAFIVFRDADEVFLTVRAATAGGATVVIAGLVALAVASHHPRCHSPAEPDSVRPRCSSTEKPGRLRLTSRPSVS